MPQPQTGFERDGQWTSLADQTAFLEQLATETSATLTTAGMSTEGRPIYRVDLGEGTDQTLLISSLIHANEPAPPDALLPFLRDLAYSDDPDIVDYLTTHRIVALVPCNPDSFPRSRLNAEGININRDFYQLRAQETRVIVHTISEARPDMILDIHEFHGTESQPDWMYRGGGNPITHPDIRTLETACADYGNQVLQTAGYSTQPYWAWLTMRAGMSTLAGPNHSVGVLSETNTAHTPVDRVRIQREILDLFREWHEHNADACKSAVDASRQSARTSTEPVPLYTHEYVGTDTNPEMLHLSGYQLAAPMPEAHRQAFAIQVDENGFVPMQQDAQWVIPTLFDPDSPDAVTAAVRVIRRVPLPTTPLAGMRVGVDGGSRPVVHMRHRVDGITHEVQLPGEAQ